MTLAAAAPSSEITLPRATRWDLRYCLKAAGVWLLLCAVFGAGISVRRWAWTHSEDIRFRFDINNGFRWGLAVNQDAQTDYTRAPTWSEFFTGYRNLYAREMANASNGIRLDYSPFRLLIMSLWVKSILAVDPSAAGWIDRDVSPLLWFNTFCAFAAAFGAFFVVRLWLQRLSARQPRHPPRFINTRAFLAATCLWLNPAVLIDAHVWPQWDIWCVPFYIWAIYASSVGAWFWAGVLIAFGAMFKGQILLVAPALLIWAAFSNGWWTGLRNAAIALLIWAALGVDWQINMRYVVPAIRYGVPAVLLIATLLFGWWRGMLKIILAVLGLATAGALVGCIWLLPDAPAWAWVGSSMAAAIVVGLILIRPLRCCWFYYASAVFTIGIVIGCWHFQGSLDWLYFSFVNPTNIYPSLNINTVNLAMILAERYGWQYSDILFTVPTHWFGLDEGVSINLALRGLFTITLILCGLAAAVQARRQSPRTLIALAAPWVLMYAILPQMHERYLLWGAAVTSLGVGINLELTFLFLLTTWIACANILWRISNNGPLADLLRGMLPDIAWVTVLLALIYLYQAWKRDPQYT